MDKDKLETYVQEGLSTREIANLEDRSQSSVKYWLAKYSLKTKRALKEVSFKCKFCGELDPREAVGRGGGNFHKSKCKSCHNKNVIERARKLKEEFVIYKGGKCEMCSYAKCLAALEFHHIDPSQKDPEWKNLRLRQFSDAIKAELDKCMLVCRNCHAEIHYSLKGDPDENINTNITVVI